MDFDFPFELIPILIIALVQGLNQVYKSKKKKSAANNDYPSGNQPLEKEQQNSYYDNSQKEIKQSNTNSTLEEFLYGLDVKKEYHEEYQVNEYEEDFYDDEEELNKEYDENEDKESIDSSYQTPTTPTYSTAESSSSASSPFNTSSAMKTKNKSLNYKNDIKSYLRKQPNFKKAIILNEIINQPKGF